MAEHLLTPFITLPHRPEEALGRLLSVRGGGACKQLVLEHAWAIRACVPAFRGGRGDHLMTLVLGKWAGQHEEGQERYEAMAGEVDTGALGRVLPLLPGLRRLVLRFEAMGPEGWGPVWAALAAGACPRLEQLDLSPRAVGRVSEMIDMQGIDLAGLVWALRARSVRGSAKLQQLRLSISVGLEAEGMALLASGPALPVERLHLQCTVAQQDTAAVVAFLRGSTAWQLADLALHGKSARDAMGTYVLTPADDVISALAESGESSSHTAVTGPPAPLTTKGCMWGAA